MRARLGLVTGLAMAVLGCGDDDVPPIACTTNLVAAVVVTFSNADDTTIDSVTAELDGTEQACVPDSDGIDGGGQLAFICYEAGPGEYTIVITSAGDSWTGRIDVPATLDGCHVSTQTLRVDLSR